MKILWFAITPCGAAEKLTPKLYTAGWLASLEEQLKDNDEINLSVCFYTDGDNDPFEYKNVAYYPVSTGRARNKLQKLKNRISLFKSNRDRYLVSQLNEVIKMVKPDIIHVHGCEGNFGLVQEFTKVPVVISIQSILNPYLEKFFSGIPLNNASKNESFISKIFLDSAKSHFFLFSKWAKRETEILKQARFIIGRTNWDKRITRILAPNSEYFIGNEIMRSPFYINTWNKEAFNKKIQIVTTMSNGLYKGLEAVLKTASLLTYYKFDFEWIIIGQSEGDSYPTTIKNWLKKDFALNNIILCGRKNQQEVVDILCNADIYCQVSHIENSPNSVCEAMLLGMPIIATFAGGTDSIVEHNKEGILVQDGDSFSLSGTILEMANDFARSKQYGLNARKTALDKHHPKKVANEVMEVYRNIYNR